MQLYIVAGSCPFVCHVACLGFVTESFVNCVSIGVLSTSLKAQDSHSNSRASTMASPTDVCSRFAVMKDILTSASPTGRLEISKAQTASLLVTFDALRLASNGLETADYTRDATAWLEGLTDIRGLLRPDDYDEILNAITCVLSKRRRSCCLQKFMSLLSYMTDAEWDDWLDNSTFQKCSRILYARAYSLSCEMPCENSTKLWTSALLVATQTHHQLLNMDSATFKARHGTVKHDFKRFVERAGSTGRASLLACLPADPEELRIDDLDRYRKAYGDAAPVLCKMDLNAVKMLNHHFGCRGYHSASPRVCMNKPELTDSVGDRCEGRGDIVPMVMHCIKDMQQQNMVMMQQMMRAIAHPGSRTPALDDTQPMSKRSDIPALEDAQPGLTRSNSSNSNQSFGDDPLNAHVSGLGGSKPARTTAGIGPNNGDSLVVSDDAPTKPESVVAMLEGRARARVEDHAGGPKSMKVAPSRAAPVMRKPSGATTVANKTKSCGTPG